MQHIPWRLSPPTKNVTLSPGSLLRKTFETNIIYLLGQYSVDDVLYWFRDRAGKQQPPGAHNHGWDGGPGMQWTRNISASEPRTRRLPRTLFAANQS